MEAVSKDPKSQKSAWEEKMSNMKSSRKPFRSRQRLRLVDSVDLPVRGIPFNQEALLKSLGVLFHFRGRPVALTLILERQLKSGLGDVRRVFFRKGAFAG
jgi:hypothetical protein